MRRTTFEIRNGDQVQGTQRFTVILHTGPVGTLPGGGSFQHLHLEKQSDRPTLGDLLDQRECKNMPVVVTGAERLTHAEQRYLLTAKGLPQITLVLSRKADTLTRSPDKAPPLKGPTTTAWMWSFYLRTTAAPTAQAIMHTPAPRILAGPKKRRPTARRRPQGNADAKMSASA